MAEGVRTEQKIQKILLIRKTIKAWISSMMMMGKKMIEKMMMATHMDLIVTSPPKYLAYILAKGSPNPRI